MPNGDVRRQRDRTRLVGAAERERLHEAVARLDHVGRAVHANLGKQRRLDALARGVAGVQALDVGAAVDEGEQAGGGARRDAERVGDLLRVEPAQLRDCDRRAERADRAGRMEAALAQIGRAGAREADRDFVASDDRLDDLRAARATLVADAERRRYDRAAAMRRADTIAVVQLDAVRRRAAEERRIEQVVALRPPRHRNACRRRAHVRQHRLGIGRDIARRARDHHADGIEQMTARVVAHLVIEIGMAQTVRELDDRVGRACGGVQRVSFGGMGHAEVLPLLDDLHHCRIVVPAIPGAAGGFEQIARVLRGGRFHTDVLREFQRE